MTEKKEPSNLSILFAAETNADLSEMEEKDFDQVYAEFKALSPFWQSYIAMASLFFMRAQAGMCQFRKITGDPVPPEEFEKAGAQFTTFLMKHTLDEWNAMIRGELDEDLDGSPSAEELYKILGEPN